MFEGSVGHEKVIGVAGDVNVQGIRGKLLPEAYSPLTAGLEWGNVAHLTFGRGLPPLSLPGPVRRGIALLDNKLLDRKPARAELLLAG